MTDQPLEELREKDRVVLECIGEGRNDTQKITEATTLETHEVRYSLKKLEQLGFVTLEKSEGMVERVVDGQKRVFKQPTRAHMTNKGKKLPETTDRGSLNESFNYQELMEKVHLLEDQVEELSQKFELFREQVQRNLK